MTDVLIKRGHLDTDKCTQGEHCVKIKRESKLMLLQDKECQRLPGNHQKLGERHSTPGPWASGLHDCETVIL